MDPLRQTRIWPHEYNAVYEAYNRIFNCQGHGWSNIQSMHINLPFANDSEFEKLHAAIRLVLPLIPALAASSPIVDGKLTGFLDNRLEFYRRNQKKIPSLVGQVIPEPLYTKKEYQDHLLKKLYQDVAAFDATRVLAHEWVNSRGAIARFDRSTIEIRLIDMQECPLADLSIAAAIISLIRLMIQETWSSMNAQKQFSTEILSSILLKTVQDADSATLDDPSYLSLFGISGAKAMTAGQFWQHLIDTVLRDTIPGRFHRPLEIINNKGPLARRIIRSLDHRFTPNDLHRVYGQLIDCLHSGTLLG
jgi:hypothetical protein